MKLEAGEFYLSASGNIYEIDYISNNGCCYTRDSGIEYYINGKFWNDDSDSSLDLIAHIPKELHWWICNQVERYHTDELKRTFINQKYRMNKLCIEQIELIEQIGSVEIMKGNKEI